MQSGFVLQANYADEMLKKEEEEMAKENVELLSYIQNSTGSIEKYLELLMDVVNHESLAFQRKQVQNDIVEDTIFVDQNLLKRAIINVMDNAVRYSTKEGEIQFYLYERESELLFELSDRGKGFSAEALKKATDQFYTEDASRTHHNYGLGLSFVKSVCQLHGGVLEYGNRLEQSGAWVLIRIEKVRDNT